MEGLEHCRLPEARPIDHVTPSAATSLAMCKLRAAYRSDPSFQGQEPSSQAARLGNVAHRVLELAGRGAFGAADDVGWRAAFETAWDAAMSKEDNKRRRSPLESHWPPPA